MRVRRLHPNKNISALALIFSITCPIFKPPMYLKDRAHQRTHTVIAIS